jgi:hypothetical protein
MANATYRLTFFCNNYYTTRTHKKQLKKSAVFIWVVQEKTIHLCCKTSILKGADNHLTIRLNQY